MRKTQTDVDDIRGSANVVLQQAVQDPSFAQMLGNPTTLAQQLAAQMPQAGSVGISDAQFFQHASQYCIDIPSLSIHVCLPIGGAGF
jgi:hypothetical protein